jgi:hypothetical protein
MQTEPVTSKSPLQFQKHLRNRPGHVKVYAVIRVQNLNARHVM